MLDRCNELLGEELIFYDSGKKVYIMSCDIDFAFLVDGGPIGDYASASVDDDEDVVTEPVDASDVSDVSDEDSLIRTDEHFYTDARPQDTDESTKVTVFVNETCGCKLNSNEPCSKLFSYSDYVLSRSDYLALSPDEKDVFVLTLLKSAGVKQKEDTTKKFTTMMDGHRVCIKTFFMLNAIGSKRFYNLLRHYQSTQSVAPRIHGNNRRMPANACKFADVLRVKNFLINYSEDHAVFLPGSHPNFRNFRVQVLDCNKSKKDIWNMYVRICTEVQLSCVSYTQFVSLWNQLVPYIVVGKPKTDLCGICQTYAGNVTRSINAGESAKLASLKEQEEHLYRSERARLFYKQQCLDSKVALDQLCKERGENIRNSQKNEACSFPGYTHISFDYAQQLHIPTNPEQPGPMYFLTGRKVGLFGINNEAKGKQVNYLIDEGMFIGKGANSIISFLHHYCESHGLGETELKIHADNCVGQNKNNFLIQYFMWRVLTGRHEDIMYSFMIAGHTKFSCDRCFGLIKILTRKTFISSICDIARCIDVSSPKAMVNLCEMVGLENGHQFIDYYDWKTFLGNYFKNLPEIIQFHHFTYSSKFTRGNVVCSEFDNSEPITYNILKDPVALLEKNILPSIIKPKGLSKKRKDYLAKEVRPYCRPGTEDVVAPLRMNVSR